MRRNERGITLIALAVTIVVLLILAGVTITYALGDNGIFSKAQDAKAAAEQSVIRDAVSNAQAEVQINVYTGKTADMKEISALIQQYLPSGWTVSDGTSDLEYDSETGLISGDAVVSASAYTHTFAINNGVADEKITSTKK